MEKRTEWMQAQAAAMHSGCSAVQWTTEDGLHLMGRNFDFTQLAEGTGVVYVPRGIRYYLCGSVLEGTLEQDSLRESAYAAVGVGFLENPSTPVLYEGVNEKGLMGGQLYYREFASFPPQARPGTDRLQPPFAVYHLLAQCATVAEVAEVLEQQVTLVGMPLFGTVPPLHWMFTDRTGESIVVEPDREGLHIYRRTVGVMTNSPGYAWHRLNLLRYGGIQPQDHDGIALGDDRQAACFSGTGAIGLPGDWSSPSRFVRLAFLRQYGWKGTGETEGVNRLLHVMDSAAFPLGMVEVTPPAGGAAEGECPCDYTVYTSVMCAETGRFYWITHENRRVQYVGLDTLADTAAPQWFDLGRHTDFLHRTDGQPHSVQP